MGGPSLSLPEELGAPERTRREVVVGRRTDGGESRPTILRWFQTWATGDDRRRR